MHLDVLFIQKASSPSCFEEFHTSCVQLNYYYYFQLRQKIALSQLSAG